MQSHNVRTVCAEIFTTITRKVHHGHNGRNTHTRGHLVVPFFSSSPYYCRKFHGSVFNNFQLQSIVPPVITLSAKFQFTFNCDQVQCQNFNGSSQFSICLYHPFPLLLSPLSGYVNDKIENRIIWFPEKEMIFLVWLETCARAEVIYWEQKNTQKTSVEKLPFIASTRCVYVMFLGILSKQI